MFADPRKASSGLTAAALAAAVLLCGSEPASAQSSLCSSLLAGEVDRVVNIGSERVALLRHDPLERPDRVLRALKEVLVSSFIAEQGRAGSVEWSGLRSARVDCGSSVYDTLRVEIAGVRVLAQPPEQSIPTASPAEASVTVERLVSLRANRQLTVAELEQLQRAYLRIGEAQKAVRIEEEIFRCNAGLLACQ